jgi:hypothetical protein
MSDFLKDFGRDRDRRRKGGKEEEFVQDVLNRTSGSACGRALGMLPDLSEGRLGDLDRQLVQAHLEHCTACRQVAVTLGWLGGLLPDMAEVDPGPAFTETVLARTSRALSNEEKAVRAGENFGPARWLDRLGRWWQAQLEKPQFALQFAYVATVLILALTATPWSPLKEAPGQALEVVRAGPAQLPVVSSVLAWGDDGLEQLTAGVRGQITSGRQKVDEAWDERATRSRLDRKVAVRHLEQAWDHVSKGELGEAGYECLQAGRRGGRAWRLWWMSAAPAETETYGNSSP